MSSVWEGSRIRLVTCQDRERRRGVRRRETLPWPPISRTRGVIVVVLVSKLQWMGRSHGFYTEIREQSGYDVNAIGSAECTEGYAAKRDGCFFVHGTLVRVVVGVI